MSKSFMPSLDQRLALPPPLQLGGALSTLPLNVNKALLQIGHKRRWPDGAQVQRCGQVASSVMIVLSGRLRMLTLTHDGEERLLRWIEPSEAVAVGSALAKFPSSVELVACGNTELLHVESERMLELIRTDGETAVALVQLLSRQVGQLLSAIADQGLHSLRERVWATLLRLAAFHGSQVEGGTILRMSQRDIAEAVPASRQRTHDELNSLQARGLIRLAYRSILLVAA
jgi:CRP/FNR family transcriptional regulator, cyclic AMP receptor protein